MNDFTSFNIPAPSGLVDYEMYITGNRIIYQSGNVDLTIRVQGNTSGTFILRPGQYVRVPFSKVYISCPATSKAIGLVICNNDDIHIGSVDGVTINSDNSMSSQVLKGNVFNFSLGSNGDAVNYPIVQLLNPSTSGKLVEISSLVLYSSTTTTSLYGKVGVHADIGGFLTTGLLPGYFNNYDPSILSSCVFGANLTSVLTSIYTGIVNILWRATQYTNYDVIKTQSIFLLPGNSVTVVGANVSGNILMRGNLLNMKSKYNLFLFAVGIYFINMFYTRVAVVYVAGKMKYTPAELAVIIEKLKKAHPFIASIPTSTMLGLIFTESSYEDGKINSSSGAIGLCQIIPSTYSWILSKYSIKEPVGNGIYGAENNILVGMYYLQYLVGLRGGMTAALHSYNVGPGAYLKGERNYSYVTKVYAAASSWVV